MNRAPRLCTISTSPMSSSIGLGFWKPKEDRGAPGFARVARPRPLAFHDQVGVLLEPAVPLLEVQHRLAEILVIGDGHMHRVHAALAHLAKDLFRPVGVLQVVDHASCGVPDAM